jgi:LmbE family N-acetylglucosaminyl deacetylase
MNICVHWVVFGASGRRAEEAAASADRFLRDVSQKSVTVHQFRDGFFPAQSGEIKEAFEEIKLKFTPDLVFTHTLADRHQDHRVLSDLTWNTFRDHLILEYEIPKFDGDLGSPNFFVHLDDVICGEKVRGIIESFPSQAGKHWFTEDTFYGMMRIRGVESAAPRRYAEAFYCRKVLLHV